MSILDNFLFKTFPYIAIGIFVVGFIYRYRQMGFKVSSLSSQFLEGKRGFWGTVPFHFGILVIFLGHLTAWLFPGLTLAWNSSPVRLIAIEILAFSFGLSVLIALAGLILRRLTHPRLQVVTTRMDLAIEVVLLVQIVLGCWIALGYRWGSSWFAADLSPYLWSIVKFNPQINAIVAMPVVIKYHIVGVFLILLLIPFTRLIHFLVAPFHYLWRPYQRVMWYWNRKAVRSAETPWSTKQPRNN